MYTGEEDQRPRIVIDLSEPNIEVKKLMKQGSDAKRLKLSPFVLTHNGKPLYEVTIWQRFPTALWHIKLFLFFRLA